LPVANVVKAPVNKDPGIEEAINSDPPLSAKRAAPFTSGEAEDRRAARFKSSGLVSMAPATLNISSLRYLYFIRGYPTAWFSSAIVLLPSFSSFFSSLLLGGSSRSCAIDCLFSISSSTRISAAFIM